MAGIRILVAGKKEGRWKPAYKSRIDYPLQSLVSFAAMCCR